jgi:hypothetical protein
VGGQLVRPPSPGPAGNFGSFCGGVDPPGPFKDFLQPPALPAGGRRVWVPSNNYKCILFRGVGVLGAVATWVALAGSRAAGREAQTPRLAGDCGRQARGFLGGGALRCLAVAKALSKNKMS